MSLPSGRGWIRDDPPATDTEGHWDSRGRIVTLGFVLPALFCVWALADLIRGSAYLPQRPLFSGWLAFGVADEPLAFFGIVLLKLAIAALAFTIWAVGNHPRYGWYAEWIGIVVAAVGIAGFVMLVVGVIL